MTSTFDPKGLLMIYSDHQYTFGVKAHGQDHQYTFGGKAQGQDHQYTLKICKKNIC